MSLNVVIMAAGKGTRMKSARPKVLHRLAGRTEIGVNSLHNQGVDRLAPTLVGDAVARLIDKGSATLSRQQVQDRLDALKTTMSISGAPGQVSVSLSSRREHLAEAIALAGELLRQPALQQGYPAAAARQAVFGRQAVAHHQDHRRARPRPRAAHRPGQPEGQQRRATVQQRPTPPRS